MKNSNGIVARRHAWQAAARAVALPALLVSCGGGGGGGDAQGTAPCLATAPCSLAGTDTTTLGTTDLTSKIGRAGQWLPLDTGEQSVTFWGIARLGPEQREGLVVAGWPVTTTGAPPTTPTPTRVAVFGQAADGTMSDVTASVLPSSVVNGAGSVIVADFNGDGLDDILLPSHNESPFAARASTAFISRAGGGFDRVVLADAVADHDARVIDIGGKPTVFARSFMGPASGLVYTWNGTGFDINTDLAGNGNLGATGAQSNAAGYFGGDAQLWLAFGDMDRGPSYSGGPTWVTAAYRFDGRKVTGAPVILPKPYFNDKPEYAGFPSLWDPANKSHSSRLWVLDLNQDGLPDIMAGQELYGPTQGLQKSVFQLLINHGGMAFADETDALAPEYNKDSMSIDYSVRIADLDGSGIPSILLAGSAPTADTRSRHGNYLLVNDGTGRLYAALHDEFRQMSDQVTRAARPYVASGQYAGVEGVTVPLFHPYRRADGKLNYVAALDIHDSGPNTWRGRLYMTLNLGIDLRTDYRRSLTVPTRNGSRRIRTFAGDDTIHRALADPDCEIDGGLGTNTAVYPGRRADWVLARDGNNVVTVRPVAGGGGTDRLTRVQRARFDDQTVDLTLL